MGSWMGRSYDFAVIADRSNIASEENCFYSFPKFVGLFRRKQCFKS